MKNAKALLSVVMVIVANATSSAVCDPMERDYCSNIWNEDKHESNSRSGIRLPLLHHQHPCSRFRHPQPSPSVQGRDHELSASLFFRRRRFPPTNISMPVSSAGKLYGFVAQIGLGSPPRKYNVLVDTGSSFSWVQCEPCIQGCYDQSDPLFDGSKSFTYRTLSCSSTYCRSAREATKLSTNCTKKNTCIYEIQYSDLSVSVGYLSADTIVTASTESFPGFIFGCSQGHEGRFGKYAGIIGLGDHNLSFVSQVAKESAHHYRAFSYYLPSPSSVGYVQVGSYDEGSLSFTPMFTVDQLYYIELSGITVDGMPLNLTEEAQVRSVPIMCNVDLGSPLSVVPRHVFDKLSDAVAEEIEGYERVESMPWCFDPQHWSTQRVVPTVEMLFRDGVRLELDESKLMSEPQRGGRICIQIERGSDGFYMLGSQQLKMLYVVQDLEKSRMGFPGID
ncbi:unnamed protein product [Urochloa humidicola]